MAAKKESVEEKKSAARKKSSAATENEEKKSRKKSSKKQDDVEISVNDTVAETAADVVEASEVAPVDSEPAVDDSQSVAENAISSDASSEEETPTQEKQSAPAPAPKDNIKRYDIIITSERPGYRPPRAAVGALVQQLAFRGFAKPVDEAVAEKWTEIYFVPGVSAHEIFIEKAYESDIPVFEELCFRFSEKAYFCDYTANPQRPLYWSIEIRGCRFTNPIGVFRKLFIDAVNLRIETAHRDFTALPPHAVVPPEEVPVEKKKRERSTGLAGTEVQEM